MMKEKLWAATPEVVAFLEGKSAVTLNLLGELIKAFSLCGDLQLHAAKTMIGISNGRHRVAWITQLGRNFVHVVFPFPVPYPDNLCFQKIAQVPGAVLQFNHHLRIYTADDLNEEVRQFIDLAYRS